MISRNLTLRRLVAVFLTAVLAVIITSCGGGGGMAPPPVDDDPINVMPSMSSWPNIPAGTYPLGSRGSVTLHGGAPMEIALYGVKGTDAKPHPFPTGGSLTWDYDVFAMVPTAWDANRNPTSFQVRQVTDWRTENNTEYAITVTLQVMNDDLVRGEGDFARSLGYAKFVSLYTGPKKNGNKIRHTMYAEARIATADFVDMCLREMPERPAPPTTPGGGGGGENDLDLRIFLVGLFFLEPKDGDQVVLEGVYASDQIPDDGGNNPGPGPTFVDGQPTVTLGADKILGTAPLNVTFTATAQDNDTGETGNIVLYEWDLDGNGQYETTGETIRSFVYQPGTYNVKMRVTDDEGNKKVSNTVTITVTEKPNDGLMLGDEPFDPAKFFSTLTPEDVTIDVASKDTQQLGARLANLTPTNSVPIELWHYENNGWNAGSGADPDSITQGGLWRGLISGNGTFHPYVWVVLHTTRGGVPEPTRVKVTTSLTVIGN